MSAPAATIGRATSPKPRRGPRAVAHPSDRLTISTPGFELRPALAAVSIGSMRTSLGCWGLPSAGGLLGVREGEPTREAVLRTVWGAAHDPVRGVRGFERTRCCPPGTNPRAPARCVCPVTSQTCSTTQHRLLSARSPTIRGIKRHRRVRSCRCVAEAAAIHVMCASLVACAPIRSQSKSTPSPGVAGAWTRPSLITGPPATNR